MQPLHFFDCDASFGMRSVRLPGSFYKKEELLERMDAYSIERAMVWHAMTKEYDPQTGNEILMASLKGNTIDSLKENTRLIPVWAVLPHYTGEFDEPETLIRKMRETGIRAVTMFPSPAWHNYSLSEYNCGALFTALAAHRIPLLIGLDQLGSMQTLGDLCKAHPDLPIIVVNVTYRIDRDLYPLLERFDNFYIETSGYKVMNGISEFCSRFGSKRLIFGTGMPVNSGSAAVGLLSYADISDEDKQKIASGNLTELLGGVRYE